MAEETWALQRTQWGKQAVLLTAVPATIRLVGLEVEDDPNQAFHEFGPQGELANTLATEGLVSSTHKISGRADYNEMAWLLAGALGNVAPTTPTGGTNSKQRVWTPPVDAPWTPMIITQERGDTNRGRQYPDLIIKTFEFGFGPDKFDPTGEAFAAKRVVNHSLTASLSGLPEVPILGEQVKVYLDTSLAQIGQTQLIRYFEGKWGISDIYEPEFPGGVNATGGYGLYVQKKPKMTGQLTLEADTIEDTILALQDADAIGYLRIEATGPVAEAAINYKLTIDSAVKFTKTSAYKAVGKASALAGNDYPFTIVKDPNWTTVNASGQFCQIKLINMTAAI